MAGDFAVSALTGGAVNPLTVVAGRVLGSAAIDIKALTGVDATGFKTVIEQRMAEHIFDRHGPQGEADTSMKDVNDVARMQYVIDNYDRMEPAGKATAYTTLKGNGKTGLADTVSYIKAVNGTYYVVEAIPDTKAKTTYVVSAYMSKNDVNKTGTQYPVLANSPTLTSENANTDVPTNSIPQTPENSNGNLPRNATLPEGTGAASNPYDSGTHPSRVGTNTFANSPIFQDVDSQQAGTDPKTLSYDITTERESMAGDFAVSALTGGAVNPLSVVAGRVLGSAAQEAKNNGASDDEAATRGILAALTTYGVSKLSSVSSISKAYAGKGVATGWVEGVAGKVAEKLAKTAAGKAAVYQTSKLLSSGIGEALEEMLEKAFDPVLDAITYKGAAALSDYGNTDYYSEMLYDGLIGGIMGFAGGGVDVALKTKGVYDGYKAQDVASGTLSSPVTAQDGAGGVTSPVGVETAQEGIEKASTGEAETRYNYIDGGDIQLKDSVLSDVYDKVVQTGKSVEIPSDTLAKYDAVDKNPAQKLMNAVKEFYDNYITGQSVVVDLNGGVLEIRFENDGKRKSVGWRMKPDKAATFEKLLELTENSKYAYSETNRDINESTSIPRFHYYIANAIVDGKNVPVKIQIRDISTGRGEMETRYYTHNLQKTKGADSPVAGAESANIDSDAYSSTNTIPLMGTGVNTDYAPKGGNDSSLPVGVGGVTSPVGVETAREGAGNASTAKVEAQEIVSKIRASVPLLDGNPIVSTLDGTEFKKSSRKLTEQVGEFFKSLGNSVFRSGFGNVVLDERGVKNDIAHGIGRAKAITFAAIPDVIAQGAQIDYQPNWKDRGYDSYLFAAPVEVEGLKNYVGAVVLKDGENRFYLHEVVDGDGNIIFKKTDAPETIKTGVTIEDGVTGSSGTSATNSIPQTPENSNGNLPRNATLPEGTGAARGEREQGTKISAAEMGKLWRSNMLAQEDEAAAYFNGEVPIDPIVTVKLAENAFAKKLGALLDIPYLAKRTTLKPLVSVTRFPIVNYTSKQI